MSCRFPSLRPQSSFLIRETTRSSREMRLRFGRNGKPRSSARSRTIYLNFAFIVVSFPTITYTTLHSCFLERSPFLSFESRPFACSRGAVKRTTISEMPIETHVNEETTTGETGCDGKRKGELSRETKMRQILYVTERVFITIEKILQTWVSEELSHFFLLR